MSMQVRRMLVLAAMLGSLLATAAAHTCIGEPRAHRLRRNHPPGTVLPPLLAPTGASTAAGSMRKACKGGLCVGMHNGPHEGGNASYPVGSVKDGFTHFSSTMTVPEYPEKQDGVCFYIWTDIFFGDVGEGRMNQFVPQLILGNALDGSSGPPLYKPHFGKHTTYKFGAHYFFETVNGSGAAYGELFDAYVGETLFTSFVQHPIGSDGDFGWTLTMGALNDSRRVSTVVADQPYMGIGKGWPVPAKSWTQNNFTNMCLNSCWEMYGTPDAAHFPSSGAIYELTVEKPASASWPWLPRWDEDEGAGTTCATSKITEKQNQTVQAVKWQIGLPKPSLQ